MKYAILWFQFARIILVHVYGPRQSWEIFFSRAHPITRALVFYDVFISHHFPIPVSLTSYESILPFCYQNFSLFVVFYFQVAIFSFPNYPSVGDFELFFSFLSEQILQCFKPTTKKNLKVPRFNLHIAFIL